MILPELCRIEGLADSKTLSAAQREFLAASIRLQAVSWGIGVISAGEIDRVNILQASVKAMSRAVCKLRPHPRLLLIDGSKTIPDVLFARTCLEDRLPEQRSVIKGDARIPAVSAASILAKVFRDRLMDFLDLRYPGYGFAENKGSGAGEHLEALRRAGPCPQHRRSFKGVLIEPQRGSLFNL